MEDGRMEGWKEAWMHGCMDAWMDGWMDGWMDVHVHVCTHVHALVHLCVDIYICRMHAPRSAVMLSKESIRECSCMHALVFSAHVCTYEIATRLTAQNFHLSVVLICVLRP